MKNNPTYDAFSTRQFKGKTYWTRLGVGFGSGKGVSLYFDGMPPIGASGQYELVLLPYKDRKAETEQQSEAE